MDSEDVQVDPTNIQVINDWLASNSLKEIHGFLGFSKFYHRFISGISLVNWPLNQVTKGGAKENFV